MAEHFSKDETNFIKRATSVKKFNLKQNDFISLKYKNAMRHLFSTYVFPEYEFKNVGGNPLTPAFKKKYNSTVHNLRSRYPAEFEVVYKDRPAGFGPGEFFMFLLVDDAFLGGGSSGGAEGADINIGKKVYELKSVSYQANGNFLHGFYTGGTVDDNSIIERLWELKQEAKRNGQVLKSKYVRTECGTSDINLFRKIYPDRMKSIDLDYSKLVYNKYFKFHPTIFTANKDAVQSNVYMGDLLLSKAIDQKTVSIYAVTQNKVKPKIQL